MNDNKVLTLIKHKGRARQWEQQDFFYNDDESPSGSELREMVGGYLELVNVIFENRTCQAIINENGKLDNLPVNYEATRMYRNWLNENGFHADDVIVGNMAIMTNFDLD